MWGVPVSEALSQKLGLRSAKKGDEIQGRAEISRDMQIEIDQGIVRKTSFFGSPIPEDITALEHEPVRRKNLEYF